MLIQPATRSRRRRHVAVPAAVTEQAARQYGLIGRWQCRELGMPKDRVQRLIDRGEWREVARGVLQADPHAVEREDWPAIAARRAMVGALAGGREAILVGSAALAILGVQGAPLTFIPEFALLSGGTRRRDPGFRERRFITRELIPHHPKTLMIKGIRVAGPLWALRQVLPGLSREHAVAVLDSALNTKWLSAKDVPLLMEVLVGARGVRSLRKWLTLVDGRAESPLETRARLVCLDSGLPPDGLQRVIHDAEGRFVARCDLVWDLGGGRLLIIEMDGAHHRKTGQISRDNTRDNELTGLGHVVYHLDWSHLWNETLPSTVRRELLRHGRLEHRVLR